MSDLITLLALSPLLLLLGAAVALLIAGPGRSETRTRPTGTPRHTDEAVLLGPVSAWVAEGEARAVREWREQHGHYWGGPVGGPGRMLVLGPGVEFVPLNPGDHRATTATVHDLLNRPEPPADNTGIEMVTIR